MSGTPALLHEPWPDRERQRQAYGFGLWLFLATEVLFFAGLLFAYAVVRATHAPPVAEAARHADVVFGTANTAILMTSSLSMAIADRAVGAGRDRLALWGLLATLALGLAFLGVKGFEYAKDLREGLLPGPGFALGASPAVLFWGFYWVATGVHAVHVSAGLALIVRLILFARRRSLQPHRNSVETTTLYWHLVDVVWVVLYPLIYLVGRP
jgi:cytochrome c oxidase subunit 3